MNKYEKAARSAGYTIAQNITTNRGFYWRPDDGRSWSPPHVFDSAGEAWRNCCTENNLTVTLDRMSGEYQRAVDAFVQREIFCCMSAIVAILGGVGSCNAIDRQRHADGADLCDAAAYLFAPVLDYEQAARDEGFIERGGVWYGYDHDKHANIDAAIAADDCTVFENAKNVCEAQDTDPNEWTVYEHWAVSNYLAEKLEAAGERIDRNFGGLNVWGRTTSGQAISIDRVICDIYDAMQVAS